MKQAHVDLSQYLFEYEHEICPSEGEIAVLDGTMYCTIHSEVVDLGDAGDVSDNEVPWL